MRPFVDATLTNTEAGKESLVAEGTPSNRVVVLENGVDTARFKRFILPDTSKKLVRIGCVANLRSVKNIDGLMHAAMAALKRFSQLVFEVAGDGEQRESLERLHAELGLGQRFVLRGSVPDVPNFLRTVDVAVLPSFSEGMSNAHSGIHGRRARGDRNRRGRECQTARQWEVWAARAAGR